MMVRHFKTPSRRFRDSAIAVLAVLLSSSCAHSPHTTAPDPSRIDLTQLWIEPSDIEHRDLFNGPGGADFVPRADAEYVMVKADRSGYSKGYRVQAPDGTVWDVKLGPEAQTEVVASRILWAIGYHQPPTHYLSQWVLTGTSREVQGGGRFRPVLPDWKVMSDWSWYRNDFVDTTPFKGLIVANLILNNWDWKTSNNKIYANVGTEGRGPERRYIVRDLGASFGKTSFPLLLKWTPVRGFGQGTRNDLKGFESQQLIKHADGADIDFDYKGMYRPLVDSVAPGDVIWTCKWMARISDSQWDDAFRAAAYSADVRHEYIAKLKEKIAEGLALPSP